MNVKLLVTLTLLDTERCFLFFGAITSYCLFHISQLSISIFITFTPLTCPNGL